MPRDKDNPTVRNRKDQTFVLVYPIHCHAHTGNHKQHVPIPPQEVLCDKGCCVARYCLLVLARATTVHTFQGFDAGFQQWDLINQIVARLNNLDWEKKCLGAVFVVSNRARIIGVTTEDNPYPSQSNLFYIGQIGATRFTQVAYKKTERRAYWYRIETHGVNIYNRSQMRRRID